MIGMVMAMIPTATQSSTQVTSKPCNMMLVGLYRNVNNVEKLITVTMQ